MVGKVIAVPWMANAVESCWNTWTMHASLTLHFAFFTIFAFFAFYAKVPFFLTVSFPCINKHWFIDFSCCWWLTFRYRNAKKTHRRNIGIGIDFNWHWHRFVACVLLLMRWTSKHLIPLSLTFSHCLASWLLRDARQWKAHCRICLQCMRAAFRFQICIWAASTQQMVDRDALLLSSGAGQRIGCDPAS